MSSHLHFDFAKLSPRDRYKLMIGTIVPRPIAFVTTVDREGRVNAAPYSFFNCLSADPPIVVLGIEYRAGQRSKDTGHNIATTGEFTVNIVSDAIVEAMAVTAAAFGPDVNEIEAAGLTAVPGEAVGCPRILESPAAFECRRYIGLEIGHAREIVLGEVIGLHIREDAVDGDRFHVDPDMVDAVGRMGGHGYARTRERFDLKTPTLADLDKGQVPVRVHRADKPKAASDGTD